MLKKISKESKTLILLEFTKVLLKNSTYGNIAELNEIIKEQELEKGIKLGVKSSREEIKEKIREQEKIIIKEQKTEITRTEKKEMEKELEFNLNPPTPAIIKPRVLRIPEPRLPLQFQYLKPTPHPIEINLGKLNPFLNDPVVRRIESNGPGERVVVMVPIPKFTEIILDKSEIDDIIKTFEAKSKIPAIEGIYNVAVGKYLFSAIISNVIGSKFSISKINYAPIFR